MPVENSTPNRAYPLPFADNNLVEDVDRLIVALMGVDLDVANLVTAVATKAAAVHGHTIADTTGLQGALDSKQDLDEKGQANGFASLDATGKVPTSQLPAAVLGAVSYQGVWNAATNTPTIPAASAANKGHYFKVATAGSTNVSGETDWKVGDWIISNGATWDKADHTDQVMSVAGLMGVITAAALKAALEIAIADVSGLQTALSAKADAARKITTSGLATGGGTFQADREIAVAKSTTLQAVAGVDDSTAMTPVRVKEAALTFGGAPHAVLEDRRASGTSGGTFTAGAWQTRTLNTKVRDPSNLISLLSNQFTPSVDGWVEWRAPANQCGGHQSRLYNVTDAVVAGQGTSEITLSASATSQNNSTGGCAVVAGKTYRIEHQCTTTRSGGFGESLGFGGEVYSRLNFWRNG